ncbi:terminase small subunit [Caballeronia peredens]|nr:terminase small subunit [Caballeronia peredens]
MNFKQQVFVTEYLKDRNAMQAAIRAGYSAASAHVTSAKLMKNAEVKAAIDAKTAKVLNKLEVSVERILQERARMAFYDPADIARERLRKPEDIANLPEDARRVVAGWDYDAKGKMRVKLADKNASLTALEKHLNMYRDDAGDGSPLNIHIHLGD